MISAKCNLCRIAIQWFHVNRYSHIPYTNIQPYISRVHFFWCFLHDTRFRFPDYYAVPCLTNVNVNDPLTQFYGFCRITFSGKASPEGSKKLCKNNLNSDLKCVVVTNTATFELSYSVSHIRTNTATGFE